MYRKTRSFYHGWWRRLALQSPLTRMSACAYWVGCFIICTILTVATATVEIPIYFVFYWDILMLGEANLSRKICKNCWIFSRWKTSGGHFDSELGHMNSFARGADCFTTTKLQRGSAEPSQWDCRAWTCTCLDHKITAVFTKFLWIISLMILTGSSDIWKKSSDISFKVFMKSFSDDQCLMILNKSSDILQNQWAVSDGLMAFHEYCGPQTLAEICRNMDICCSFRAGATREKYPGFISFEWNLSGLPGSRMERLGGGACDGRRVACAA